MQLPTGTDWLLPSALGAAIDLLVALMLGFTSSGGAMVDGVIASIGSLVLMTIAVVGILILAGRRGRSASTLALTLGMSAVLVTAAPPSHAFDVRRDEVSITVAAGETIDDTLVVMAESVIVEGTITGDLVAMGERVTIRGRVDGSVVAMARTLSIEGEVGGTILTMGEQVEMRGASLGGNAYGLGRTVIVDDATRVLGNAALAADSATVRGSIGRDLLGLTKRLDLSGTVDGNLRAYAQRLELADSARVGGTLSARVETPDAANVAAGARIDGDRDVRQWHKEASRYVTPGYYIGEVLQFIAAFVTGLVLMRFFPGLLRVPLTTGGELLTAAAMGALALIAVPALAVVAIVTLIGAPLGLAALLVWGAGLYASLIVTALRLGERLLGRERQRPALELLAGLLLLFVLINVPLLGAVIRLIAMLLGLGVIVLWLRGLGNRAPPA